jgi:hypothetical protein
MGREKSSRPPFVVKMPPMASLTPSQQRKRDRIESVIGLMAPALTLVLAAGDRLSRIVQPEDYDYYPVRPIGEWQPRPSDMSPEE